MKYRNHTRSLELQVAAMRQFLFIATALAGTVTAQSATALTFWMPGPGSSALSFLWSLSPTKHIQRTTLPTTLNMVWAPPAIPLLPRSFLQMQQPQSSLWAVHPRFLPLCPASPMAALSKPVHGPPIQTLTQSLTQHAM